VLPVGIIIMALTNPPDSLQAHELLLAQAAPDLVRIGDAKYPNPVHWSKLGYNRFDSPEAPYGIFYTAEDFEAALIEVFGDDWVTTRRFAESEIRQFKIYAIRLKKRFRVVDLTGEGLARAGTDANICTSPEYTITQKWAIAFMQHRQEPQGLRYHSRHNPKKFNYALFGTDGVKGCLEVKSEMWILEHPKLYTILDKYGVAQV
jgi:crotonobetainyl-CoA:carnitine CoA-transferase CaiB-like acyl-CoA transferase